jgi:hypothetical protein
MGVQRWFKPVFSLTYQAGTSVDHKVNSLKRKRQEEDSEEEGDDDGEEDSDVEMGDSDSEDGGDESSVEIGSDVSEEDSDDSEALEKVEANTRGIRGFKTKKEQVRPFSRTKKEIT